MKKLSVTIQVEFGVPDSWELVQHPDDIQVIKLDNGNYMDMTYTPLLSQDFKEAAQWTTDSKSGFINVLWGMVTKEEVRMELKTN